MKQVARIAFLLFWVTTPLLAQPDCGTSFRGTKTLYKPKDTASIATPEGYEPVLVNFVTRHGARHPTSLKDLQRIERVMKKADSLQMLTANGAWLLSMTRGCLQVERNYTPGNLSKRGEDELAGIGRRMARQFPFVKNAERVAVRTTKQQRTRQSARAFFKSLGRPYPQSESPLLNDNDSIRLRFYDIAPAYLRFVKDGTWKAFAAKVEGDATITKDIKNLVGRWFKPPYAALLLQKADGDEARAFVLSVYSTAAIEQAILAEIKTAGFSPDSLDMTKLFRCDELQRLEILNDAEDFLVKGPGTNPLGIQVKIAAPLLADFIRTSDSLLSTGQTGAVLRFCHAETIAPFAALMGIEGAAKPSTDILHFNQAWTTSQVIPFSANIQWIFYRNKNGHEPPLVAILMNEKPVRIPVLTKQFPYYSWPSVKAFYEQRLKQLGALRGSDMYQYLLSVQE